MGSTNIETWFTCTACWLQTFELVMTRSEADRRLWTLSWLDYSILQQRNSHLLWSALGQYSAPILANIMMHTMPSLAHEAEQPRHCNVTLVEFNHVHLSIMFDSR